MARTTRREFSKAALGVTLAASLPGEFTWAEESKFHIACNEFCWINMYQREGRDFTADRDAGLAEVKRAGMDGIEMMLSDAASASHVLQLIDKHALEMRSFYTGATLHNAAEVDASITRVMATAEAAKRMTNVQVVVVNPTPLNGQQKTDAQLATQAQAMTRLGQGLFQLEMALAYHFHAPAWRNDGREFHHLLNETDPKLVQLCLDTHWVYRGTGNNVQQVYDVVRRYAKRVVELHLRQSRDGIWTECMSDGDIDYRQVAAELKAQSMRPLLVLEQAVEAGTPQTIDAVESHRRSRAYVERIFAA